MDDSIRRQAVKDWLLRWEGYIDKDTIARMRCRVIDIPSAQPFTDEEIQKMQDLEQAEIQKAYELGKLDAMEEMPKWIPVSERLPEDEENVLVTRHFLSDKQLKKNSITEAFYVEVAKRMDDEWISYSDEYKIKRHLHKVIAWMPLPDPYKEEE